MEGGKGDSPQEPPGSVDASLVSLAVEVEAGLLQVSPVHSMATCDLLVTWAALGNPCQSSVQLADVQIAPNSLQKLLLRFYSAAAPIRSLECPSPEWPLCSSGLG